VSYRVARRQPDGHDGNRPPRRGHAAALAGARLGLLTLIRRIDLVVVVPQGTSATPLDADPTVATIASLDTPEGEQRAIRQLLELRVGVKPLQLCIDTADVKRPQVANLREKNGIPDRILTRRGVKAMDVQLTGWQVRDQIRLCEQLSR